MAKPQIYDLWSRNTIWKLAKVISVCGCIIALVTSIFVKTGTLVNDNTNVDWRIYVCLSSVFLVLWLILKFQKKPIFLDLATVTTSVLYSSVNLVLFSQAAGDAQSGLFVICVLVLACEQLLFSPFRKVSIFIFLFHCFTCLALGFSNTFTFHYSVFLVVSVGSFSLGMLFSKVCEWFVEKSFSELKRFLPVDIAKKIIENPRASLVTVFPPAKRYSVCICSDWRGFQDMSLNLSAKEISIYFESYYTYIFSYLETNFESGYFADWYADELFVTFYGDQNSAQTVNRNASKFLMFLTKEVPDHTKKNISKEIIFDIGVASGSGIVGIQGPANRLKTTIVSKTAGVAKRMETIAKNQRTTELNPGSQPFIACPSTFIKKMSPEVVEEYNFRVFTGKYAKDLKGIEASVGQSKVKLKQAA